MTESSPRETERRDVVEDADVWIRNNKCYGHGDIGAQMVSDLVSELRRLREAQTWQPIETAPKNDGEDIIVVDSSGLVGQGFFDRCNAVWRWLDDEPICLPTHWMPLPSGPDA